MNSGRAISSARTKIEITDPQGRKTLLGWSAVYTNPVMDFLIGRPLRAHLWINTQLHNRRMRRIANGNR